MPREYEPCTGHLERLTCVHCGERITEQIDPAAMREHIAHQCNASARPGCSWWYDALYLADAGAVFCLDCIPEDHYATMRDPEYPDLRDLYTPLAADDEADSYASCDGCLRSLHYHRLTTYGEAYEAPYALAAGRDDEAREHLACVIDAADEREIRSALHALLQLDNIRILEEIASELTGYRIGERAERRESLRQSRDEAERMTIDGNPQAGVFTSPAERRAWIDAELERYDAADDSPEQTRQDDHWTDVARTIAGAR